MKKNATSDFYLDPYFSPFYDFMIRRFVFTPISYYIKINLTMNHYYKLLWFIESFEVNFNIGFGIPIEFPSQRKKNSQIGP